MNKVKLSELPEDIRADIECGRPERKSEIRARFEREKEGS